MYGKKKIQFILRTQTFYFVSILGHCIGFHSNGLIYYGQMFVMQVVKSVSLIVQYSFFFTKGKSFSDTLSDDFFLKIFNHSIFTCLFLFYFLYNSLTFKSILYGLRAEPME